MSIAEMCYLYSTGQLFFQKKSNMDVYRIIQQLKLCASDPRWAVSKKLLTEAVYALETMQKEPTNSALEKENKELRLLLAIKVSGVMKLYTDDGEIQDNSVLPYIDFKNDSIEEIKTKLYTRAINQYSSGGCLR